GAIVCLRAALGTAVLLPLAVRTGALEALRGRWGWLVVVALVQVVLPFLLITLGEHHVATALAGILVAAMPLWTALLAARFDDAEVPRGWRAAGVVMGIAGVVLLFGVDLAGSADELLGGALILGAALAYAIGPMLIKHRLAGVSPVGFAGPMMAVSALATLPLLVAAPPPHAPAAGTVAGLVVLGAGSTGIAFLWYYTIMREVGPGRASIVSYLAPPFALLYGTVFLGESLGAGAVAGIVLILAGSWLAVSGRLPGRVSRTEPSRSSAPAPARAR
ncbi:MAG TPA: DMT family transporter, partial [Solirubrobacteraceae bacterium]|nr:DMT family transporter [Solirubrobacteraceae bacterium]